MASPTKALMQEAAVLCFLGTQMNLYIVTSPFPNDPDEEFLLAMLFLAIAISIACGLY